MKRSWKICYGGPRKSWKSRGLFVSKSGNPKRVGNGTIE